MNQSLEEAVAILAGTAPASQERYTRRGLSFDPRHGHQLVLDADEAPHVEQGVLLRLRLYSGGSLVIGLTAETQDATGEWSAPVRVFYEAHKDHRHSQPMPDCEEHLLPPSALQLDLIAASASGLAMSRKSCKLPTTLFRALNNRVRNARGQQFRPWLAEQQTAIIRRDIDSKASSFVEAVVFLAPPEQSN
jgi:hypothetical protein